MYSNLRNVQILVSGLKSYGVRNIVVSPGNSHNAFVRSLEEDDFFTTYSITDERSAAFFACGLAQELKEPVGITCTAGTAASNYLSGVTEAFRRGLPLVVLTGDKNPYYLAQGEDQMIDAPSIFSEVTRASRSLVIVQSDMDAWYCNRVVNEALMELDHHGCGPVHINIPIEGGMLAIGSAFSTLTLPAFRRIERVVETDPESVWKERFEGLAGKRVLILYGQDDRCRDEVEPLLETIAARYNCAVAVDKLSNLHASCCFESQVAHQAGAFMPSLKPDVLISLAGNPSTQAKFTLKEQGIEHWDVNEEGRVRDYYKTLSVVFEASSVEFLRRMAARGVGSKGEYLSACLEAVSSVEKERVLEYSNLYATRELMRNIPKNSILNLANSTTIRIAQLFDLDDSVEVYCNRGVNGIDGCMSAFIGQSAVHETGLSFLIIGDLTFFYDLNALWNRYVKSSVRIMLVNNGGASLFHFNQGLRAYPKLNENVAAAHGATAKGWVESLGIRYLSANDKDSFQASLAEFVSDVSDRAIVFEVFTDTETDARVQHDYYDSLLPDAEQMKRKAKSAIKKIIGRS